MLKVSPKSYQSNFKVPLLFIHDGLPGIKQIVKRKSKSKKSKVMYKKSKVMSKKSKVKSKKSKVMSKVRVERT